MRTFFRRPPHDHVTHAHGFSGRRQLAIILTLVLCSLPGCSTHFSTLQPEGSTAKVIYTLPDEHALHMAYAAMIATFPGEGIIEIPGAVRGYSSSFRFNPDTYSQQILVYPVHGRTTTGQKIAGVYFEVSGSGTSFIGRAKNVELAARVQTLAQATGTAETVVSVEARGYEEVQEAILPGAAPPMADARGSMAQEDPSGPCLHSLGTETRFAPVADKMPITDVRDTTFAMLANESFPRPEEKPVIADLVGAQQACFKDGELWRQHNYPPQIGAMLTEAFNNGVATAADLYNGKLSYSAFNKRRQAIADDARHRVAALVQQIQNQRHAEQQAQKQARAAQQQSLQASQAQATRPDNRSFSNTFSIT